MKEELNRFFELCRKQINNENDDLGLETLAEYMRLVADDISNEDENRIRACCNGYEAMQKDKNVIII